MKNGIWIAYTLVVILAQPAATLAQTHDTLNAQNENTELFTEISTLNPDKASILSAAFPGLGQIYNKQYWKLPIIYGAAFAIGYYIRYNNQYYHTLRNVLISQALNGSDAKNPFGQVNLQAQSEQFRRDRDFLIIIGVAAYLLNVVDAHISAHLEEFAINDELSLSLRPSRQTLPFGGNSLGLSVVFNIR